MRSYCKKCRAEKWQSMPLVGKLFHQIQISSKKGKLKNQRKVSKEELEQVIKSQTVNGILYCAATGVKLVHDITSNPLQPSVDRINCSRGYELGNIRIVACTYNLMRRTWDDKVVIEAIIQMAASIDKRVGQK